jgi:glycosyltransferase involved in cell wall biosynthesis
MKADSLSIVIPVYNDQEVLLELVKRLNPVIEKLACNCQLIFVDDGSTDESFNILRQIQKENHNVKLLKLARNFGQQNSISAGLNHATGDYIVIIDSDLQDRPEDIPLLIEKMEDDDTEMAIAKRKTRDDKLLKKIVSNLYYELSRKTTGIKYERGLGVFRVIRKEILDQLIRIPENTGTIISLMYWSGISYSIVNVNRDKRFAGSSGYNLQKMGELTSDRIFSYSLFPIRIATRIGLLLGLGSFSYAIYLILKYLMCGNIIPGYTSMMVVILFLFGITFIFLGILGEYLGRIYIESKGRPKYILSRIIESQENI